MSERKPALQVDMDALRASAHQMFSNFTPGSTGAMGAVLDGADVERQIKSLDGHKFRLGATNARKAPPGSKIAVCFMPSASTCSLRIYVSIRGSWYQYDYKLVGASIASDTETAKAGTAHRSRRYRWSKLER